MVRLNLPTKIITERLLIQPLKYEDAEEIFYGYASKPEATRFVAWPTHKSIDDTRNFLRYVISAWKMGTEYAFSIRSLESGRLVGSFGVINDNGKLQFGYILNPSQWGNGYATEVCKAMMKLLSLQEGVYRIQSFVDVENTMSANVLNKCGLVEEARLPNWFRFVNQGDTPKDCILFRLPLA
jgi:ribosomal-protein-alanine N-acetyltransferase